MSGKRNKKERKAQKLEKKQVIDARAAMAFMANFVPREEVVAKVQEPALTPEEKELTRIYKTFATTVWRMKNVLLDTETGEPKEELNERSIARLAKYLETLEGALEDAHVTTKGDYVGKVYDEGEAVKVIAFEDRKDLTRDEYIETLIPTVRWTNGDGKMRLLQQAEVVVGKAPRQ